MGRTFIKIAVFTLFSWNGWANQAPEFFSFDGVLVDSSNNPLVGPVSITLQIYDPTGTCLLYEENAASVPLDGQGAFSLNVGTHTRNTAADGNASWKNIFTNGIAIRSTGANCASNNTVSAGGERKLRVTVGGTTLSPDFTIASVPFANMAGSLQGKVPADFVSSTGGTVTGTLALDNSPLQLFDAGGINSVSIAVPASVTTPYTFSLPPDPGSPSQVLTTNGSGVLSWTTPGGGSGDITDVTVGTGLAGGGVAGGVTISLANTAVTPGSYGSASQLVSFSVDAQGRITGASNIPLSLNTASIGQSGAAVGQVLSWNGSAWIPQAAAGGAVTSVAGKTGVVTLNAADIVGLGTAALKDYGVGANQLVELNGSAQLPAVNGQLLTNVNAAYLQTYPVANMVPGVGQVLAWNGSQWQPTVTGGGGSVTLVSTGVGLLGGPITTSGSISVDVGTTANKIVQLNGSAQLPAVSGANLTNVNAAQLQTRPVSSAAPSGGQVLGWNSTNSQWEPQNAAGGGTVTQVVAGQGLVGGTITGMGTLGVDLGVSVNQVPQLGIGGQIALNVGSTGNPTYAFTSATNTGMMSPGSGNIAFVTFGTERMRVTAAGQVSINTSSPVNGAALDVFGIGTGLSSIILPRDTTANRPAGTPGMMRYNTTTGKFEAYELSGWFDIIGSGGGGGGPVALSDLTSATSSGSINNANYTQTWSWSTLTTGSGLALSSNSLTTGEVLKVSSQSASASSAAARILVGSGAGKGLDIDYQGTGQPLLIQNSGTGANFFNISAAGKVAVGTATAATGALFDFYGTGSGLSAIVLPRDSSPNRPTGVDGMIRYNTTTQKFEGFENGLWVDLTGVGFPLSAPGSGVAASPEYTFSGDFDTGIFSPSVDTVSVSAAGLEQMTVTDGLVDIGTWSGPYTLSVVGDGAADAQIRAYHSTSSASLTLFRGRGTPGSPSGIQSGDNLGDLIFTGQETGGPGSSGSFVSAAATQAWSGASNGSDLSFWTTPNNTVSPELRLMIGSEGVVGIGTATPTTMLDIDSTLNPGASAILVPRDSTGNRPPGAPGMVRYNTTNAKLEAYQGNSWGDLQPKHGVETFTTSGTFTVPPGVTQVKVTVIGAGGGADSMYAGGRGGAGVAYVYDLVPGSNIAVTVGAAGTYGSPGTAGGNSQFGAGPAIVGSGGPGSNGSPPAAGGFSPSAPSGTQLNGYVIMPGANALYGYGQGQSGDDGQDGLVIVEY
ncbi:MAG: beta strand repeat-containing protein [Bdellovibrionales bacterium]